MAKDSDLPWQIMKSGDDWDWYVLLDAKFRHLSDASVEGDAVEWTAVAEALVKGESIRFKRLAVDVDGDSYRFYSPRNTMGRAAVLTGRDNVLALAASIATLLDREGARNG